MELTTIQTLAVIAALLVQVSGVVWAAAHLSAGLKEVRKGLGEVADAVDRQRDVSSNHETRISVIEDRMDREAA